MKKGRGLTRIGRWSEGCGGSLRIVRRICTYSDTLIVCKKVQDLVPQCGTDACQSLQLITETAVVETQGHKANVFTQAAAAGSASAWGDQLAVFAQHTEGDEDRLATWVIQWVATTSTVNDPVLLDLDSQQVCKILAATVEIDPISAPAGGGHEFNCSSDTRGQ